MRRTLIVPLSLVLLAMATAAQGDFEKDTIETGDGDLVITFIGHGSVMFEFGGDAIYVDPFSQLADYSKLPKARLIAVTHGHPDHLDVEAIAQLRQEDTIVVTNEDCAKRIDDATVMKNGETKTLAGLKVEAVPAYNLEKSFHPKGRDNGFVITFGGKRVYIAGDTENVPEMKDLKDIDIAFLPMNLPYTMSPEMAADAAKMFLPKVCYPYHTGDTDLSAFTALMKDVEGVEVRIRSMK